MISDPLAVLVVLAAVVLVSILLEERFALFRSLGAALVGILVAMALSNAGLLPGDSPTYQWVGDTGVSLAVALILLSVDVRSVIDAGPGMLGAFAIGAGATVVGASTAALLLASSIGPETWKLAGQFTGTYTGGSMNFVALGQAFETSSELFSAAVAADVALTAIWMVACLAAPLLFGEGSARNVPATDTGEERVVGADDPGEAAPEPPSGSATGEPPGTGESTADVGPADPETTDVDDVSEATLEHSLVSSVDPVSLRDAAALATLTAGAVWAAGRIAASVPAIPEILWLTTVALLLGQIPVVKALRGAALWGNYLLLLFLAAIGAQSVVANIFRVGPAVFWFAVVTIAVHGIGIFGIGRLFRIDAATLAVASQANVGGPASAIALASARGYADRLLPGVAVGLLGYAAGNYAGFVVAAVLRGMLVG